ncbi:hypothetical protein ACFRI6_20860, partial [Bacillus subtilis]
KKGNIKVKIDSKTLEIIKVLSLVVIAISSVCIAFWLAQIITLLDVIGGNLGGINNSLIDLSNR